MKVNKGLSYSIIKIDLTCDSPTEEEYCYEKIRGQWMKRKRAHTKVSVRADRRQPSKKRSSNGAPPRKRRKKQKDEEDEPEFLQMAVIRKEDQD
jgi:hypothetical protein